MYNPCNCLLIFCTFFLNNFEIIYFESVEYFVTKVPSEEVAAEMSVVVECDPAIAVIKGAFLLLAANSSGCH